MRQLVCLLLIISLVCIMVSPAFAVGFESIGVAADIVLQSIVMGLGVFPKDGNESAFSDLITSIKQSDQIRDFIDTTGAIITHRPLDALEPGKRFVARALVQTVSNFLWKPSTNVITSSIGNYSFVSGFTDYQGTDVSLYYPSLVFTNTDGQCYIYWLTDYGRGNMYKKNGVGWFAFNAVGTTTISGVKFYSAAYGYNPSAPPWPGSLGGTSVSYNVVDSLRAGLIGQSASITDYPAWVDTETQVVGQTGALTDVLALGLVDTLADTLAMTQEQVIVLQDAIQKAEVATQPEVPDGGNFTMDLTRFFPFCIPYDIYAILSALSAAPETPHIDFNLDLGITQIPVHADLSAFDSAAAVLRRLELLLFIIGLGMVTREKFLRG